MGDAMRWLITIGLEEVPTMSAEEPTRQASITVV